VQGSRSEARGPEFSTRGGRLSKIVSGWHRKVEDKLKAAGMSYTNRAANGFLQNIVAFNAPSIRTQGAF